MVEPGAATAIRCPACNACLGELRDGVAVVDLHGGHGSRVRRTIIGALEIHCGRRRKDGPCGGVWKSCYTG